jgi:sugar phosphate permease
MPMFLGQHLGFANTQIANIQTSYEVGVIFGTLIRGYLSDRIYSRRSPVGMTSIFFSSLISFLIYTYYL